MLNNFLLKLWFKIFNKGKYNDFKNSKRTAENLKFYKSHIFEKILKIQSNVENKKELSFLHSGRLGDLIYSLATIKELAKSHKCKIYIQINKPVLDYYDHLRKVLITKRSGDMIIPLLKKQEFLEDVSIYNGEKIDVNFDLFRDIPINKSFYSSRWFSHLVGINLNMESTFLSAKPHKSIKNKIIIGRSPRYRNSFLNYKFLKNEKNIMCIGLKDEYDDLKKDILNLEFYDCNDFLEMAEIIKSCKFYIGNMSLQYIMAEGLKVPRLLEASPDFPVSFPLGPDAFDAYHQNHFENFFKNLNKY